MEDIANQFTAPRQRPQQLKTSRSTMQLLVARPLDHPIRSLCILFVGWKVLLLLIAAFSPGPGYDTSTTLQQPSHDELPVLLSYMLNRLLRWDAIYFVKVSNRGYVFEQDWAWGWGFTRFIALCTSVLKLVGVPHYFGLEALVAVTIAHISHLLSVLVLYSLTSAVFPKESSGFRFTSAFLQIISPAGLFLSAPYAESSTAFLSFAGILLFSKSLGSDGQVSVTQDLYVLMSGVLFGLATTCRSNGILNGILLLEEAFTTLFKLQHGLSYATIRRLAATGLGGLCVGAGFLLPQYIAYSEYCTTSENVIRPWCHGTIPSIYTFVQNHYWDVGPFRYWTLSNLPLFLLAAPMFTVLIFSGVWALDSSISLTELEKPKNTNENSGLSGQPNQQILYNLAGSQLILVLLTSTTAHVQIITRIASSYPVWMWFTAALIRNEEPEKITMAESVLKLIVVYGIIQAGLFASFLPPA